MGRYCKDTYILTQSTNHTGVNCVCLQTYLRYANIQLYKQRTIYAYVSKYNIKKNKYVGISLY